METVFKDPAAWYEALTTQSPGNKVTPYADAQARTVGFTIEKEGEPPHTLSLAMEGCAGHSSQWTWHEAFPRHRVWHGFWAEVSPEFRDLIRTPAGRKKIAETLAGEILPRVH